MIRIKTQWEIELIRKAGKIAGVVLKKLEEECKVGVKTKYLDSLAEQLIRDAGAKPAFKGYKNYPATICVSVNSQVVHGIPAEYELREGDIVGIDLGTIYKSYYADIAATFPVGKISSLAQHLIKTTKEALCLAISQIREGNYINDISSQIQYIAESNGFSVVRDLVGHGTGIKLHEEPQIHNYSQSSRGPILKKGMVLAPEPMINAGNYKVKILNDGWTVVTLDESLSAHFEHTVAVSENGPDILTLL